MKPETEHVVKWSGYDVDIKDFTTFSTQHRPLHYYEIAHLCNNPESFRFMNQIRNDQDAWLLKYTKDEQEYIKNKLKEESISKIKRYIRPCPHMKCKQHKGDELVEMHKKEKLKEFSSQLALECNVEEQKLLRHKNKIAKLRGIQLKLENKLEELDNYKRKIMTDKETQLYREMIYFQEKIKKAKEVFAALVNEYSDNHPQQNFTVTNSRILNDTTFDITCKNINKENGTQEMTRIIEKINFVPRLNLLDIKLQEASKPIGIPGTFLYKSPRNIRNQHKGIVYGCSPGREDLPYVPKKNHTGVYEFDEKGQKRWSCCLNTDIISDGCNNVSIISSKKDNKKDNNIHKQHRDGSICNDLQSLHGSMAKEIKDLELPNNNNNTNSYSLDFYPRTKNISAAEWSSTLRTYSRHVDRTLNSVIDNDNNNNTTNTKREIIETLHTQSARDSYNLSNLSLSEKLDNEMSLYSSTKPPIPSMHSPSPSPSSIKPSNNSPRVSQSMRQSLKFMRTSFSQHTN